ncbi:hypothetical protein Tcan_05848 [Toxocara canis]|uniref:Uncharacterized protein n=1 Tax=Toxocara canis TaxID=6265 RepID=A0A0B2VVN3_TOXCA|nr:hypothetical protein Tcan_05848 [Toxocara canis]
MIRLRTRNLSSRLSSRRKPSSQIALEKKYSTGSNLPSSSFVYFFGFTYNYKTSTVKLQRYTNGAPLSAWRIIIGKHSN